MCITEFNSIRTIIEPALDRAESVGVNLFSISLRLRKRKHCL